MFYSKVLKCRMGKSYGKKKRFSRKIIPPHITTSPLFWFYYSISTSKSDYGEMPLYALSVNNSKTKNEADFQKRNSSFGSDVKFFGTNFAQTFFVFNSPYKIFLTVSLLVFTVLAIIWMLILRSPRIISLISVTVCGVKTHTGQPGQWSFSVLSRPWEYHFWTAYLWSMFFSTGGDYATHFTQKIIKFIDCTELCKIYTECRRKIRIHTLLQCCQFARF